MSWTDEQRATVDGLERTGFHMDSGEPCECGPDDYVTRSKVGYSDFVTFTHKCRSCGNKFTTYIEG